MPTIAIYAVIALAALAAFGGFAAYERKAGADKVRAELQPKLTACEGTIAQVKVEGEAAAKRAAETKAADEKRKKDADAENAATHAADLRTITKLRADADRARGRLVPAAPAGSKCPPDQACFDATALESAIRVRRDAIRGLADESAALEADMNTSLKWARSLSVR